MNYETINSTTGLRFVNFPVHIDSEAEEAIAHAHSTYQVSPLSIFGERAALLRKVAGLMRQRIEPLAAMITLEMRKLIDHIPHLPFGRLKGSGTGLVLSEFGIPEFVNKRLVRSAANPASLEAMA